MDNPALCMRERLRQHRAGPRRPRMYLPPGVLLTSFFETLAELDVSYAVLRWFEQLPRVEPGEDVDLLVADADLERVRRLLVSRPAAPHSQKLDAYSVSGLPASDFRGVSYYPPPFAAAILRDAVTLRGRYRVPSTKHHLDSLAYHAVYHKGYASGLRSETGPPPSQEPTDHDYETHLGKLAAELGLHVTLTLEGLDRYLDGENLRPPLDTLDRLRVGNPWIHDRFFTGQAVLDPTWEGLAVFVLRERAQHLVDTAVTELEREGFEVFEALRLDPAQQRAVADRIRGGNWGRGPFTSSGGGPSVFVLVYDAAPVLAPDDDGSMTNLRIARSKKRLRKVLLSGVDRSELHNPVHSSDNPRQALDYLDALGDPGVVQRTHALAERARRSLEFPYPVLRNLPTETRRARVAIVDHPGYGPTVCKLFRPTAVDFFERELRARTELSHLPEVPELLEKGHNWLLTPLYTDDGSHVRRRLPGRVDVQLRLPAARSLVRFAEALHHLGLFVLDLSTQNLVSDPAAGLKVLDLEFLQDYAEPRPTPARSYTFRGAPPACSHYDRPQLRPRALLTGTIGNAAFHPAVIGLSVEELLRGERLGQGARQRAGQLAWYTIFVWQTYYRRARARVITSRLGRKLGTARWLITGRKRRT